MNFFNTVPLWNLGSVYHFLILKSPLKDLCSIYTLSSQELKPSDAVMASLANG